MATWSKKLWLNIFLTALLSAVINLIGVKSFDLYVLFIFFFTGLLSFVWWPLSYSFELRSLSVCLTVFFTTVLFYLIMPFKFNQDGDSWIIIMGFACLLIISGIGAFVGAIAVFLRRKIEEVKE